MLLRTEAEELTVTLLPSDVDTAEHAGVAYNVLVGIRTVVVYDEVYVTVVSPFAAAVAVAWRASMSALRATALDSAEESSVEATLPGGRTATTMVGSTVVLVW